MSTDKSKDKFLIANVSNYLRNTQGETAHHIQQTDQATGISRRTVFRYGNNYKKPAHFCRRNVQNGDNTNLWTTLLRL